MLISYWSSDVCSSDLGRPRSQVILRGVASAARALGISVVAEGVETAQELRYLPSIPSIRRAQGFLFARPATPPDLIATAPDILAPSRSLPAAKHRKSVKEGTRVSVRVDLGDLRLHQKK